ncbi:MAG: Tex-like N-terminal domain-containing protein, partial [bacterium]
MVDERVVERIAAELDLPSDSVRQTIGLLGEGATPPFLARYRRERTGGLGERQVRAIARQLGEHGRLARRKAKILRQLERHESLTPELRERIDACFDRCELEDLYQPHRPRRRSRGAKARERGLQPLADLLAHPPPDAPGSLTDMALPYTDPERGVPDVRTALEGARDILAERAADHPQTRRRLRRLIRQTGVVRAAVVEGKAGQHSKYEMYYDFAEPVREIPSHRILAIRRGEKEGWLTVRIEVGRDQALAVLRELHPPPEGLTGETVEAALAVAWDRLLAPSLDSDVRSRLKRRADAEAIDVFARNLRGLLLQPPAGPRRTLGVMPGYRTGCKLAAVDERGALLESAVIFPHPPEAKADEALATAKALVDKHGLAAVAIGNGNASRETDLFFRRVAQELGGRKLVRMVVNESGAKAYASSRAAREEFPDLAPALRSAVSIARRFQDPLAELVQVDPKTIGVGQYQHDVNQQALRAALQAEIESCVNLVGVDPARATAAHLAYVAGFDKATAHALVQHRDQHGPLRTRADLMGLPQVDGRCFLQAAGFLRLAEPQEPLDGTAIHPERYDLVARIAADAGTDVPGLLGNRELIEQIDFARYESD